MEVAGLAVGFDHFLSDWVGLLGRVSGDCEDDDEITIDEGEDESPYCG